MCWVLHRNSAWESRVISWSNDPNGFLVASLLGKFPRVLEGGATCIMQNLSLCSPSNWLSYYIHFIHLLSIQYPTPWHRHFKVVEFWQSKECETDAEWKFWSSVPLIFCEFWPQYYSWLLSGLRAYKMDQDIHALLFSNHYIDCYQLLTVLYDERTICLLIKAFISALRFDCISLQEFICWQHLRLPRNGREASAGA